jgi:hypothetical protein
VLFIIRNEFNAIIGPPRTRDASELELWSVAVDDSKLEALCGYVKGGSALSGLHCPFDIHRQMALDFMHIMDGIIKERMFGLFTGRSTKVNSKVHEMKDEKMKEEIYERNAEINEELKGWKLSGPQRDDVDRRWASVRLPDGVGTNYVPFRDHSTFTSADWMHLMVYAGRWIMDGILEGAHLDVWLRLCRVVEALAAHSIESDPFVHAAMLRLVVDTVIVLPLRWIVW